MLEGVTSDKLDVTDVVELLAMAVDAAQADRQGS
jgi:hypothetical protein